MTKLALSSCMLLCLSVVNANAQTFTHVVAEEKAKLLASGYVFLTGTSPEGSDVWRCSTAQITWRAAHRLAQMGHPVSLIHKEPHQGGCTHTTGARYSHDAIAFGHTCVDVIRNSETENIPAWTICQGQPVALELRRPTFALDVLAPPAPAPVPTPVPPPAPAPVPDQTVLTQITINHAALVAEFVTVKSELGVIKEDLKAHRAQVRSLRQQVVAFLRNPATISAVVGVLAGVFAVPGR